MSEEPPNAVLIVTSVVRCKLVVQFMQFVSHRAVGNRPRPIAKSESKPESTARSLLGKVSYFCGIDLKALTIYK